MSTKAGVPVAAPLTVNIAAMVNSQVIMEDSEVYGFAADETHTFEFSMTVPVGTGGKAGAVVAEVLDPNGNKLADGSLDVAIAPLIPEIVVDFPALSVLGVEGVPFAEVTLEQRPGKYTFVEYMSHVSDWIYGIPYLGNYAICAQGKIDPKTASQEEIAEALIQCGCEYGSAWLAAGQWVEYRVSALQYVATLASPITMDEMRGVTFNCKIPIALPYGPWGSGDWMLFGILVYQSTFGAPMPPPAFRGGGSIIGAQQLPPIMGDCKPIGCYAGGYYYPGIYDGILTITLLSGGWGAEGAQEIGGGVLKIKNLIRVTGTGTVVPPGY